MVCFKVSLTKSVDPDLDTNCLSLTLVNNVSKYMQQMTFSDAFFAGALSLRVRKLLCKILYTCRIHNFQGKGMAL